MTEPRWICDECGTEYDTEASLVFCCDPRWDKPSFVRSYD